MSLIHRRQFLQFAGSTLAAIALSQHDISRQGLRYARVLAQSTPRKRALLVGINRYPANLRFTPLKGCVTDVELQKELLIQRFGFQEANILCLTDDTPQKPTRANILAAFKDHLIDATQAGDVVVFHFSGHGDRVIDPNPIRDRAGTPLPNSTFVPADPQFNPADNTVSDIMGKTLFLLVSALKTEHATVVLDSCHSGGGTRGNVRIRSAQSRAASGLVDLQPSEVELAYQEQWLQELALSEAALDQLRRESVAKGVVIASARSDQRSLDTTFERLAADGTFDGFNAGVFTYFMTQYLWQHTDSASGTIAQVTRNLQTNQFNQEPLVDPKANSGFEQQPIYFVNQVDTTQTPPAEAVIQSVQPNNRATIWLGGVDQNSIAGFDAGATLTPVGTVTTLVGTTAPGEVRLLTRNGLTADVLLPYPLAPGTLLQESARIIPNDLKLRIGLDPSLSNDASRIQQALRAYQRLELVLSQPGNSPYAGEVHYILSRITPAYQSTLTSSPFNVTPTVIPSINSIGLLSQSLDAVIPGSFGDAAESVAAAIARLSPKLTALIAARLIKVTLNANSSRLNVSALIRSSSKNELIGSAFTVRGGTTQEIAQAASNQLQRGDLFEFQITNREPFDLFLSILVVGASGDMAVLFPNPYATREPELRTGQTVRIPDSADTFDFITDEVGIVEALIIVSRSPLQRAIQRLNNLAAEQQATTRGTYVTPTDDAIADLLADLSDTRGASSSSSASAQLYASDIAALSITFEVV